MRIAHRMRDIAPFRVMAILARARAMEAQGRDIVHMEIGEPDFVSPQPVIDAGRASLQSGQTHYTPAVGLPALREAIAAWYQRRFDVAVDPQRIIVTPGASGALQLILGVLVNPGDRVLVTDPGYPCNRHMITLYGGVPVALPVSAADRFSITPGGLADALDDRVRGLMVASPANPTGNVFTLDALRTLNQRLTAVADTVLICDEIYQGLQYDVDPQTALALDADNIVVINSFSKFFGMTGWRVGWLVAPVDLVEPMDRLAQNIFLAAPTTAQHAALAAFSDASMAVLEQRRTEFHRRRDFLYEAVGELGFDVGARPAGAFYLYAGIDGLADDSMQLSEDLLERGGVAITPGADFGSHQAGQFVRFAYTTAMDRLEEGVQRLRRFLRAGG